MGVEKDFDTLDTSEQLDSTGGNLEEYGVWVKSGPEDIDETTDTDSFSLENLPEIEETTSFLTEEEESLLKDLETITPGEEEISEQEDPAPELTQFGEEDSIEEDSIEEDSIEEDSIEEDSIEEDSIEEDSIEEDSIEEDSIEEDSIEEDSIEEDFNLEDLDDMSDFDSIEEETSVDETAPEHELSLDEDIFTIDTPEDASSDENMEAKTPGNEEDSLFEPEDESADIEDEVSVENTESEKDFFDLDLDSLEEVSEESGKEGFPSFNGDDFDSITLDEDSPVAVSGISESSESVFSDIPEEFNLDDLEQDEEEVLPELSVEDLEEDTEEPSPSPDIEAEIEEKSEVLKKIEEELHSIRDELSSLKSELSNLKLAPVAAGKEDAGVEEDSDSEPLTSFFEEDEDETIALTGDELDNILNTADVTEEAGKASEGPEEELDIDLSSMESSLSEGLELSSAAEAQAPVEEIQEESEIEELDLSSLENMETEQEEEIELAEPENAELELSDLESEEEFDLSDIGIPEEESAEEISFPEPETDTEEFSAPESETEEVLDITAMEDLEELEEDSSSDIEDIPEIDAVEEEELELLDNPEEHLVSDALLDGEDILDIDDEELYPGIESSEEPESFEEIEALSMEEVTDETPEEPKNLESEEILNIESENEESFEEPDFSELEIEDLEIEPEDTEEAEEVILEAETEEEPSELQDLEEEIELEISPEDSQEMKEIVENSEEEAEFPANEILELTDDEIAYEPVELDSDLEELEEIEEIEAEPESSTAEVEADSSLTAEDYSEAVHNVETSPAQGLNLNPELQGEIKSVLSYMDQLLEALPEEKIEEFARSEHFKVYQKLFDELGISS